MLVVLSKSDRNKFYVGYLEQLLVYILVTTDYTWFGANQICDIHAQMLLQAYWRAYCGFYVM